MMSLIPDLKNRETGINILGKVPWGTHFCLFYEKKEDLLDVLIPYFKAGLENNEYCMWVTSAPLSKEEAEVAARNAISDFDQYYGKKQIEIIPYDEWYLKDGVFDLQRVFNDWVEKLYHAKSQGYDGLRVTGNTAWLEKTDCKSFTDYEEDLNNFISDYEMIAICTYFLDKCGPYEILDVIHNHQFALIRKEEAWEIFKSMEQIKAETELKKLEEKYRLLIENALEGILAIDKDGIIYYVNSRMAYILGYSVNEIIGKDLTNIMDDYSVKVMERNIERRKQGVREQHDFEFLRKDGTKVYTILETTPINDEKGNYIGTLVFMADITKRKLVEQKIKESEEKFRTIFKSIPDLFFLLSEDTTILEYSGKKGELYLPPEKFLGQKAKDILPPNIGKLCLESVKNTIKTKQPQTIEYTLPISNEIRFFEGRFLYFSEKNVALFTRDITDRKRAEKKLRESEHNLKERVKELNCLYEISKLIENPKISVGEIIQGTLELIPAAWQIPDITCARIKYGDNEHKTEHFKLTKWNLSNIFKINGNILELEVFYLEDKPFLEEEVSLLKDIGYRLKTLIEQKEAEQKIIDSEEKFRTAVENSPDFMVFIKVDGTIFDVNRLEKGFTREMVIGQSVFNRSFYETEDQLESALKAISDSIETGKTTCYEFSQKAPDGTLSFYEPIVSPFRYDNEGKIISLQLVSRDITKRKLVEQEFLLHSQIMLNLYDAVNLVQAKDLTFVYMNPRCEEMFGYEPGELIGKHVSIFNATTDKSPNETANVIMRDLEERGEWHGEVKNVKKDGTCFWCYANISTFNHPEYGKVFVSVQTDITERKKAEKEIIDLSRFPSENPNPVLRVNKENVIYINDAGQRLFNINKDERIPSELKDIVNEAFMKNKTLNLETILNDKIYLFETTLIQEGGYANIYGRDITERKKAEQKLKKERDNLTNVLNTIGSGLYVVNSQYDVEYINPALELELGPLEGKKCYEYFLNQSKSCSVCKNVSVFEGKTLKQEFYSPKVDKLFEITSTPLYNPDGSISKLGIFYDITERKAVEQKLKESELKYRSIFEEALNPVLIVDENGKYVDVNKAACEFLESNKEEILCKVVWDYSPPQILEEQQKITHAPFYARRTLETPYLVNGKIKTLLLNVVPLEVAGKKLLYGIGHNITERQKVEEKLRESEEKLRMFMESATDGFILFDPELNYIDANQITLQILNISKDELIGKNMLDVAPNLKETGRYDQYLDVIKTGEPFMTEDVIYNRLDGIMSYFLSVRAFKVGENLGVLITDIAERKRMEQKLKEKTKELRESEERFRELYNNAQVAMYSVTLDGKPIAVNDLGLSLLDYSSREEFVLKFNSFNHWANPDDRLKLMEELKQNGEIHNFQTQSLTTKGKKFWSEFSIKLHSNKTQLDAVAIDITERKKAEEKLQKSEDRLLYAQKIARLGFWDLNIITGELYWSDEIYRSFGFKPQEFVPTYEKFRSIVHPDDLDFVQKHVDAALQDDIKYNIDFRIVRPNGDVLHINSQGDVTRDAADKAIRFVGTQINITERKKAEEKILEEREKAETYLDLAGVAITALDKDGNITLLNKKGYEILQYDEGELIGKNWFETCLPKHNKKEIIGVFETLMKGELDSVEDYENIVLTKNGEERLLAWKNIILYDDDGNITGALSSADDITDRKKAEEEIANLAKFPSENPNPVLRTTKKTVIYSNKAGERIFNIREGNTVPELLKDVVNEAILTSTTKLKELKLNDRIYSLVITPIKNENYTNIYGRDITEGKKAEQKLKESEERFRSIFEHAAVGIAQVAPDGAFMRINQRFCDILKYSQEEILAMSFPEITHPDDVEENLIARNRLLKGEISTYNTEKRYICKDGSPVWVSLTTALLQDLSGNPKYFITIIEDISEKKKLEEERNKFFNLPLHLLLISGLDGIIKRVNPGWTERLGYETEELEGKNFMELVHPDDRAATIDEMDKLSKGITTFHFENRYRHKNGTYRTLAWSATPDSGKNVVYAIAQDITERKRAEEKLKASEERFRTLYENIAGGTLIVDENFIIKDVNERTCEITGYTRDELIGQLCDKLCARKSDYQKCPIWEEGQEGFRGMDTTIKCKDGRKHPILKNAKRIDLEGDVHILENFQDIKEKKEAEEELIKLHELKTELLTRSSHELKTPLMSIKGFTELLTLKFQGTLNDEELFFVGEIRKGCSRLETLINDILKTAELHSDAILLEKTEENLSILVKTSVKELQSFANSRNQNINLMLHDKLITSLEKKQIHQALNNLLMNAIKYTPPNGKIEIKSDIERDSFIISIKDSGIGFSEEEKSRLFKQFGKIERYGQGFDVITEGSGLGLYISKKIVELHDGNIWVESEGRHKGSTFYISLPIING